MSEDVVPNKGANGRVDDRDDDVLVYELDEWTSDERGALETRLNAEGIEHSWEMSDGADVVEGFEPGQPWEAATDLVVSETVEDTVDAILDEVESPDALEAVDDDGELDQEIYSVMGDLYVAADRLKDDPADLALAGAFFDAADAARATDTPFGIEAEVWKQVQTLATAVTTALEAESDDEIVAAQARALRDLLIHFV